MQKTPPDLTSPDVPAEVLRLARRRFLTGERLEMSALAAALDINRTTLYRWVGSRDRLMVEVLWSLADQALQHARSLHPPGTPDRAVRVVVDFLDLVVSNPGMQHLLANEIEDVMRLLTHRASGFQPRLLAAVEDLLREEAEAGRMDVEMDPHELAFIVVRVIESYTYLDVLLGEQPVASRAEPALGLLLRRRQG